MTEPSSKPSGEVNLSLVIKLLKMSTSANDAEALVAIRKANAQVTAAGWDWERLLLGKVKIVADPFSTLANPADDPRRGASAAPSTPPRSQSSPFVASPPPPRPARPFSTKPAPPPPTQTQAGPISTRANQYAAHCYCCGIFVNATLGFIFKPTANHIKWETACANCNRSGWSCIPSKPAKRQRNTSASDLLNGI